MTVKRTWTVENTWTCDSCQAKNLGRYVACQTCGNPKEKQEKDTVPDPDRTVAVTDPELLRLAAQGANWVCEFCGGQVRDEFNRCVKNCGAPKPYDPLSPVEDIFTPTKPPDPTPEPLQAPEARLEAPRPLPTGVPGPGVSYRPPKLPKDPAPWKLIIGLGGALLGLATLLTYLLSPWEETTTVSGIQWNYRSDLHQRTLMHGTGWGAPVGSFNTSCKSKFYGTEDCHPHDCRPHSVSYECNCSSYECNCRKSCTDNKNGFSTCEESCSTCQRCSTCSRTEYDTCYDQCDVYKDWCEYDYYEWPIVATSQTGGIVHDEHWPPLVANGAEQRLDRTERYEVQFANKKDKWTLKPRSLNDFQRFNTGATWRIKVNRLGSVTPLQELPTK